jgi:nitrite reductase (NO-forming)
MKRDENKKKPGAQPEPAEPTVGRGEFPIWLVVLSGLLFYWGTLYLDANGGGFDNQVFGQYVSVKDLKGAQPVDPNQGFDLAMAEQVYAGSCASCHQPHGLGTPGQYPPLVGSDWVTAAGPNRLIRVVLHGLGGPIKVNGAAFETPLAMTPFGETYSDEQIAAVLSFIRTRKDWGHNASIVKPAQVKAIRDATAGHAPWTADEIEKVPESD